MPPSRLLFRLRKKKNVWVFLTEPSKSLRFDQGIEQDCLTSLFNNTHGDGHSIISHLNLHVCFASSNTRRRTRSRANTHTHTHTHTHTRTHTRTEKQLSNVLVRGVFIYWKCNQVLLIRCEELPSPLVCYQHSRMVFYHIYLSLCPLSRFPSFKCCCRKCYLFGDDSCRWK